MTWNHTSLRLESDVLHAAEERRESVKCDFVERLCNGYSGLMRRYATSYRSWLNALQADAQLRGEYFGGYRIHVYENGYSLPVDEATGDEEWGDRPSSRKDGDDYIIEDVVTPSNPPSSAP